MHFLGHISINSQPFKIEYLDVNKCFFANLISKEEIINIHY